MRTRWDWIGAVAGVAVGVADYGLFVVLGSPDLWTPSPLVAGAILAGGFGALGFAVGRLALARQRAARDAATIESQLHQLEEAQRSLLQQEKLAAIGRLAAGVAHEVRNPLGVIRASASMVQESFETGSDPYRACQFICEESDRLNTLIIALLNFSRPTEPRLESVAPEKLLDRALHLAGEELGRRHITVVREGDGAGEMQADPDLLSQVLLDLLLNAAEAAGERGRVVVRLGGDAEQVRLEIADDGPGVPAAMVGQIFEPFVTTKARGTGLGLPMALRIVETHGGRLEAAAGAGAGPAGAGACFRVEVPRRGRATRRPRP